MRHSLRGKPHRHHDRVLRVGGCGRLREQLWPVLPRRAPGCHGPCRLHVQQRCRVGRRVLQGHWKCDCHRHGGRCHALERSECHCERGQEHRREQVDWEWQCELDEQFERSAWVWACGCRDGSQRSGRLCAAVKLGAAGCSAAMRKSRLTGTAGSFGASLASRCLGFCAGNERTLTRLTTL